MSSQEYSDQSYSDPTGQSSNQSSGTSDVSSSTVSRSQQSTVSTSGQSSAHHKKGSNHLGLKILLGGLILVTLMFVVSNIETNLKIFWNTLVWILAIIGLIWAFIKIRELEKEHDEKKSQSQSQSPQ